MEQIHSKVPVVNQFHDKKINYFGSSTGEYIIYFLLRNCLSKFQSSFYDQSEAERVLFTNIVDDLVREPARPGRDALQTLLSQELLELNGPKSNQI